MARTNDEDMLMEDELAAAFLDNDGLDSEPVSALEDRVHFQQKKIQRRGKKNLVIFQDN